MSIVKCHFAEKQERGIRVGKEETRSFTLRWLITVSHDNYCGQMVLREARIAGGGVTDPVPIYGSGYQFLNGIDIEAYATEFNCQLMDPESSHRLWYVDVTFASPDGNNKQEKEKASKPNPLDWSTEYWIEWVEEQVPLEKAYLLTQLFSNTGVPNPIKRGPEQYSHEYSPAGPPFTIKNELYWQVGDSGIGTNLPGTEKFRFQPHPTEPGKYTEPGPIVNAAGQQTIDPVMHTVYHPILVAVKNYPTAFPAIELNRLYCETANGLEFLGDARNTWRYLISSADKQQEKTIEGVGTVKWYPVTTKLEYKVDTWDKLVLNNGQACFRKARNPAGQMEFLMDPFFGAAVGGTPRPMLFPTTVRQLIDPNKFPESDSEHYETPPQKGDFEEVESSEPVNLTLEGTQIKDHRTDPIHLRYRYLKQVDYNTMDPFLELIAEYNAFIES